MHRTHRLVAAAGALLCVPLVVAAEKQTTEVVLLGMIHNRHVTSERWGRDQVRETIRRIAPDAVCAEIPPDRWENVWAVYSERRAIEDSRVRRFPEYVDVVLPLKLEMGFEIVPCAAWTEEMADRRRTRLAQFRNDPVWAEKRDEYDRKLEAIRAAADGPLNEVEDPHVIHSEAYDERMRAELDLYDEYLNDWLGPGGWTNINEAHYALIDAAIKSWRGRRLLITFGAGHKYWFLERLRARDDVVLLDPAQFLPPGESDDESPVD